MFRLIALTWILAASLLFAIEKDHELPDHAKPLHPWNPAPTEEEWRKDFCDDPVGAICGGDEQKAQREHLSRNSWSFWREKRKHDDALTASWQQLFDEGGRELKLKKENPDAWQSAYLTYVMRSYDLIRRIGAPAPEDIAGLHADLIKAAGEKALKAPPPELKDLKIIATAKDLENLFPKGSHGLTDNFLKAFRQACGDDGRQDNAFLLQSKYLFLCPGKLELALFRRDENRKQNDPMVGLTRTTGHEVGHSIDYGGQRGLYKKMLNCLAQHHNEPGPKGGRLTVYEFPGYMSEITADYWGAVELARRLPKVGKDRAHFLRAEFATLCDAAGNEPPELRFDGPGIIADKTDKEGENGHPRGTYRILFSTLQPQMRTAMGCTEKPRFVGCGIDGEAPPAVY